MYQSGIFDNQPLVHGIIGRVDAHGNGLSLTTSAPMAEGAILIDTGAQVSVLDLDRALSLGLPETAEPMSIMGITGSQEARQFSGLLHLPAWDITIATTFVSLPLMERHRVLALVGMDVLSELVLTLDGPNRRITLASPETQPPN